MKALSTTTTTAVLKKVLQRRALLHHVATSSSANRTPPTGARKAAHTPEDAPQKWGDLKSDGWEENGSWVTSFIIVDDVRSSCNDLNDFMRS
ncbi:hypothetical protein LXL04_006044 [Taraxacum kok-saghyz]